jgi:hypothetical protein
MASPYQLKLIHVAIEKEFITREGRKALFLSSFFLFAQENQQGLWKKIDPFSSKKSRISKHTHSCLYLNSL